MILPVSGKVEAQGAWWWRGCGRGGGALRVVRATRRDRAPATADVRPLLPLIDN